jgi:hypothetical protein
VILPTSSNVGRKRRPFVLAKYGFINAAIFEQRGLGLGGAQRRPPPPPPGPAPCWLPEPNPSYARFVGLPRRPVSAC